MSMTKPTKYYSLKQERMIANYLGWSVVVASGARTFNPGDICSKDYLGECKTHMSKRSQIAIKKSVWRKISSEAMSTFKKPILFVDNGTQKIKDTWCVIPNCKLPDSIYVSLLDGIRDSNTQISFDHEIFANFVHENECAEFFIDNKSLLLMRLETFKDLIDKEVI